MYHLLVLNILLLFNIKPCKVNRRKNFYFIIFLFFLASGQISQILTGKDWSANTAAATPVLGSHVVHQSRRLYVGNIPFGVSEVRNELFTENKSYDFILECNDGIFQSTNASYWLIANRRKSSYCCSNKSGQKFCFS
jgi:hypothetical protein